MLDLFWLVFAYFMGSIPFGLIVAKVGKGIDPRKVGSRNTGATNVFRVCGPGWGVLVLFLDLLKGAVPVAMACVYTQSWVFLSLIGLCAILGHAYSMFLDWKGGKTVATSVGVFLVLAPVPLLWSVVFCLLAIGFSGYVSMGSMTLAVALPVLCLLTGNVAYIPLALVLMAIIFNRHLENIQRLARGEEKPFFNKK